MSRNTTRAALAVFGTALMTMFMGTLFLKTSWGEDTARLLVEDALRSPNGQRVVIGRLGDFELFSPIGAVRATAEDVRFLDGSGVEVVSVGEVDAQLNMFALLRRQVHVEGATIKGAQVACDLRTGRPKVSAPPARRKAFQPRTLEVQLDDVEIEGLFFVASKPDGQRVILGRLAGAVDVTVPREEPGVRMKVRGIKGVLSHPQSVRVHDATGFVDTNAEMAADLRFRADAEGKGLTGQLRYFPGHTEEPVQVSIEDVRALGPTTGSPLDALGGMGLPVEMFRGMTSPPPSPNFPGAGAMP